MTGPDALRAAQASAWVRPTSWRDGFEPGLRLFCFPHAGGGTALFQPWRAPLAPDIDVCPVLLPGRESRMREAPARRLEPLLEPLYQALLPLADRPYAFFGHSMGTILAFELAARFAARHWRAPTVLIVSGRRAPHLPARRRGYAHLPDAAFVEAVASLNGIPDAVLGQRELLGLLLPTLRADFELVESYRPVGAVPLAVPITAMLATQDPEVTIDEALEWASWTAAGFTLREFEGDHFYLAGGRPDVIAAVRADLAAPMADAG
jgi:surfactin synthase thioesterase subunit